MIVTHNDAKRQFKTSIYTCWVDMRQRCFNVNHKNYVDYGGRGITVSERWQGKDGFANFLSDMGEKPTPKHTLDRVDNSLGYNKENCRWVTSEVQILNRRKFKTNSSGHTGVYYYPTINKWRASITSHYKWIYLGNFETKAEAIEARKKAEVMYYKPIMDSI